jgi:hypothetical protein
VVDGGREGFVNVPFVTFPFVLSLLRDLCFAFYLDTGRLLKFRVPIRRREDTEGDRNLRWSARGAKKSAFTGSVLVLQNPVWRRRVALSRKPFEPFENNSKGIKKELLGSF